VGSAIELTTTGAPAKLQTTVYPWHVYLLKIQKPDIFASKSLPISMLPEPRRYAHALKAREASRAVETLVCELLLINLDAA